MNSNSSKAPEFTHVSMSEHERYLAQARMMRAEMVADLVAKAWNAVKGVFGSSTRPAADPVTARDSHAA